MYFNFRADVLEVDFFLLVFKIMGPVTTHLVEWHLGCLDIKAIRKQYLRWEMETWVVMV